MDLEGCRIINRFCYGVILFGGGCLMLKSFCPRLGLGIFGGLLYGIWIRMERVFLLREVWSKIGKLEVDF